MTNVHKVLKVSGECDMMCPCKHIVTFQDENGNTTSESLTGDTIYNLIQQGKCDNVPTHIKAHFIRCYAKPSNE